MGTKTHCWEETSGRDTEDKKVNPMSGAAPQTKPTHKNWLLTKGVTIGKIEIAAAGSAAIMIQDKWS